LQYNLVYFSQREKDTYSDLNMFDARHRTSSSQMSFGRTSSGKATLRSSAPRQLRLRRTHYDKNGFLTRPQILGTVPDETNFFVPTAACAVTTCALSISGGPATGHIGRLNITHAFYQVFGEDEFNGLAGRRVDINAQMAALELSYDRDWIRLKLSAFMPAATAIPPIAPRAASTRSSTILCLSAARSVVRSPRLQPRRHCGELEAARLPCPEPAHEQDEGQSNFVNPGVLIVGLGTDIDVTPKLKAFANLNYICFAETKPIEVALQTNKARRELGLDASLGFKFRPLLTDNIILAAGVGFFFLAPVTGTSSVAIPHSSPRRWAER
jgi:hypothetical protein